MTIESVTARNNDCETVFLAQWNRCIWYSSNQCMTGIRRSIKWQTAPHHIKVIINRYFWPVPTLIIVQKRVRGIFVYVMQFSQKYTHALLPPFSV